MRSETSGELTVRSNLVGNAGSRPISEAKQPWACPVLGWGTTGEAHVLYSTPISSKSYAAEWSEVRTSSVTLSSSHLVVFCPPLSLRPPSFVPRSSFSSRPDLCFSAGSGLPWKGVVRFHPASLLSCSPYLLSPPFPPPSVCVCVCDGETWTCTRFDLPPSSHTLPLSSPPSLSQLLSLSLSTLELGLYPLKVPRSKHYMLRPHIHT